jgi:putative cell wall-binding protein/5-hydroxyisourate hydrolase-like protein (transthyretin family)
MPCIRTSWLARITAGLLALSFGLSTTLGGGVAAAAGQRRSLTDTDPADQAYILGHVSTAGAPLAGISVTVYLLSGATWVKTGAATTDVNGYYAAARADGSRFLEGIYRVHFADAAGVYIPQYFQATDDTEGTGGQDDVPNTGAIARASDVWVTWGRDHPGNIDANLVRKDAPLGGTIHGHVADYYGGNTRNFYAWAHLYGWSDSVQAWLPALDQRVDQRGAYTINRDAAGSALVGRYKVYFTATDPQLPQWFGGTDEASATEITLGPGTTTDDVDGRLERQGSVAGRLICADTGKSLADAIVELYKMDPATGALSVYSSGQVDSAADGRYAMPDFGLIAPGHYLLMVTDRGHRYATTYSGNTTDQKKASWFDIPAGGMAKVDVFVSRGPMITGVVTSSITGEKLSDVAVTAFRQDGDSWAWTASAFTDSDGHYAVTASKPGTYKVLFKDDGCTPQDPSDDTVLWYRNSKTLANATPVNVPIAGVAAGVDVALTVSSTGARRQFGSDRYQTALQVSRASFAEASCSDVVIASGENYADALTAAGLAGTLKCPLLLTGKSILPPGTLAEMQRLGAWHATVVGGSGAVSDAVLHALSSDGAVMVDRIAGTDRYGTSVAVAQSMASSTGTDTVLLARGDGFADALGAAPVAYAAHLPILLTRPSELPTCVATAMVGLRTKEVVVIGGSGAIAPSVDASIGALGVTATRAAEGLDRYDTACKLAAFSVSRSWSSMSRVGVASGTKFPDALGGGAAVGSNKGIMLLTSPKALSSSTAAMIRANRATIAKITVYGGAGAISSAVLAQLAK